MGCEVIEKEVEHTRVLTTLQTDNPKSDHLIAVLAAMANRKRLLILRVLLDQEMTVSEIAHYTDLTLSAVSQHLAKLRAENLVTARRKSQMIYYATEHAIAKELLETLEKLLPRW